MIEDDDPTWLEATDDLLNTARRVREQFHPLKRELSICFMFRKDSVKTKGRRVLGHCEKISEKMLIFQEYEFLIWVSLPDWANMDTEKRESLIDHELCHIALGKAGWSIVGHDFEEFYDIIQRHGFWDTRLQRIDRELAYHQQSLGINLQDALEKVIGKTGTVKVTGTINGQEINVGGDEDHG